MKPQTLSTVDVKTLFGLINKSRQLPSSHSVHWDSSTPPGIPYILHNQSLAEALAMLSTWTLPKQEGEYTRWVATGVKGLSKLLCNPLFTLFNEAFICQIPLQIMGVIFNHIVVFDSRLDPAKIHVGTDLDYGTLTIL